MANSKVNSIVLVHGGFVDGSGWQNVYAILKNTGFNVSIVQNPTISLADDVVATNRWPGRSRWPLLRRRGHHRGRQQPEGSAACLHHRLCPG